MFLKPGELEFMKPAVDLLARFPLGRREREREKDIHIYICNIYLNTNTNI